MTFDRIRETALNSGRLAALFGCCLLLAVPGNAPAQAQENPDQYPSRPVTFIVPFAPGGVTGLLARLIGQKLEQRLGKPFVVEHRPGGGGVTGAVAVARAAPDGYTLMMASSTVMAINVTVRKNLPYDPRKDLTSVALLARVPFVLVVNPALPIKSVDDLVKYAKANPGKISFGTPGPGTFHHLNAEMFKSMFGLQVVHVPYKGSAPALTDLVAGHIQMMFCDVPPAKALIESGKLRALGVTTAERVKALPDVPPLSQVGMPNYNTASWHTITTTAGVPNGIVDKLAAEIRTIMSEADVQQLLTNDGAIPQISPLPAELRRFVDAEILRWGEVVKKAGIAGSE
jgi:tripartite-type tricarboxylate transporter receptor subunit TctC